MQVTPPTTNDFWRGEDKEGLEGGGKRRRERVGRGDCVRGDEIMKMFDLPPGKEVGKIKTMVEDAIINGEIKNDYSSAMSFLDQMKYKKK